MDLKANIDQLDKEIASTEISFQRLKESLKQLKSKRSAFLKLEEKAKAISQ